MSTQFVDGSNSNEGTALVLAALIATGGSLNGAKLKLFQSSFSPTPASKAADFATAEADFTGYTAAPVTWSAIGVDSASNPSCLSDRVFFQATDALSPNTIGGCWLENETTGTTPVDTAVEYYVFDNPVPMLTSGAFLGVVIGMQMPGTPGYALVDN